MIDSYDAVVAGHLCLDIFPDLSQLTAEGFRSTFLPGRLLEVGPVGYCTGGAVSNTGLALHKLGIGTRLMGKIGDDLFGQAVREVVTGYAPELLGDMIVDSAVATSYTVVISPPGADRFFLHCPGANDRYGASDIRYEALSSARLFHFGYPPLMRRMYADRGEELSTIFRQAKATGITTSLDMALPAPASPAGRADWPAILAAALPYVDIFLPSIEEILYMLRRGEYDALCREAGGAGILPLVTPALLGSLSGELLEMGPRIVGLKLGDRGLYLRTAGRQGLQGLGRACPPELDTWAGQELWAPCFQVGVVGTAGSGDATIAGFLAALLRGLSPGEAVNCGVAVGACNVEAADTLSGIRAWDDTIGRMAAGWPRHDMRLVETGWEETDAGYWRRAA